ncbi:MAG: NAD-dependent epimerase/dehydratase family protein [Verrucomicrobia bacterium]|nr:NAD-dependent epimerase/dehydratase family protein [Verrucomicrobiota bacterium]
MNALVVGCGFVGLELVRRFLDAGWTTSAITLSQKSASELQTAGWPVFSLDVTDDHQVANLKLAPHTIVAYCASSSKGGVAAYRQIFVEAVGRFLRRDEVEHLVFASSTSVYAQTRGEPVDENSPAIPDRETGKILRTAEEQVLAAQGSVARLAGIYGPGRCVPLQKLLAGEAVIEESGNRVMNSIHRDDAAGGLHLLASKRPGGIFNLTDDEPVTQLEWYQEVCALLNMPLPQTVPRDLNRKRGWTSKRVSNAKLRALGWAPKYPSFRDGVRAILQERGARSQE